MDEIQFDYIRGPAKGDIAYADYKYNTGNNSKSWALQNFLMNVRDAVKDYNVKISADVFGFVLLEAMNFNLPIITTKGKFIPASTEIVEDNKNGFLIEQKNQSDKKMVGELDFEDFVSKLKLLIEDENLRKKMGKEGKKEIEKGKFNLEKRNKRLRRIYEEALESK